MFKKLFSTKDTFIENFINEYKNSSPQHLSLEISDNLFKSVWKISEETNIGVLSKDDKVTLTNKDTKTKSLKVSDQTFESLIINNQRAILEKIEESKEHLHNFPNISNPTDGELKGEEWLKVTNHVLKESLKEASKSEDLVIDAKLFMGKRSSLDEFTIRLQCYNLDYSLTFLNNGKLYLSVFDDKNFIRGHSKTPSYSGEFFNNRPIILNEFIKLIFDIFSKSKIKIFS